MKTLKIKSMTPIKNSPVYDMEIPNNHNFILSNGVVAHNCSYSMLGYVTMWLKHYYPLEWWTSELNQSGEEKIKSHSAYLGSLIKHPSINVSKTFFTIDGDKIIPPLSVVKGIGTNTVQEIVKNAPFNSIEDFINKVKGNKVNAGHIIKLFNARALDCFLDNNIPYIQARTQLLNKIHSLKNNKIGAEVYSENPLQIYFLEKEFNLTHSRTFMSDPLIEEDVIKAWPALTATGKKISTHRIGSIPIITNYKSLTKLLDRSEHDVMVGFIGIFKESSIAKGVSKKTGKEWTRLDVILTDGVDEFKFIKWKTDKPLRLPANSIVYFYGYLGKDWKNVAQISIEEFHKII